MKLTKEQAQYFLDRLEKRAVDVNAEPAVIRTRESPLTRLGDRAFDLLDTPGVAEAGTLAGAGAGVGAALGYGLSGNEKLRRHRRKLMLALALAGGAAGGYQGYKIGTKPREGLVPPKPPTIQITPRNQQKAAS